VIYKIYTYYRVIIPNTIIFEASRSFKTRFDPIIYTFTSYHYGKIFL